MVEPLSVPWPPALLSVSFIPEGHCLIVEVVGEADSVTAVQLQDRLVALADGPHSIVLDLAGLEFCSVPGLRALIEGVEVAEQAGATVHLHGMSRQLAWMYGAFLARRRSVGARRDPHAEPDASPALSDADRSTSLV